MLCVVSRARGAYRKTAQRREEILDAAFEVFSRTGYAASSLNEIARVVGMSQPGMMHHFDGKAAMLQAVLERRDREAGELLSGRTDLDFLRGLIEIAEQNRERRGVVQLYSMLAAEATSADHPAAAYFAGRFEYVVAGTVNALEEAAALDVLLPEVDPRESGRNLVALTEGLQLLWLHNSAIDVAQSVRSEINRLLTTPI